MNINITTKNNYKNKNGYIRLYLTPYSAVLHYFLEATYLYLYDITVCIHLVTFIYSTYHNTIFIVTIYIIRVSGGRLELVSLISLLKIFIF